MKGFLTALLMFASTGMVYAQQSQNDFTPNQRGQRDSFAPQSTSAAKSGFSSQSNSMTITNQTRLAALQSESRVDKDTNNYVIMDHGVDLPQEGDRRRSFIGPENNPSFRNTNTREVSTRSVAQEQPRYSAQSSERSATSVLPSRNNRAQNSNYQNTRNGNNQTGSIRNVSNQSRPVSSIFDLHLTPEYERQLKQNGYLHSILTAKEASSDQIRLFGDTQRVRNGSNQAKIFSSQISTYQGNLVIDLDDYALQRIHEGSYSLDDFDRHDVRGVVLRYVSANNSKIDLTRLPIGDAAGSSSSDRDYNRRDVADNRPPQRRLTDDRSCGRDRGGDGDWYLPNSDSRNNSTTDRRDSRDDLYLTSSLRRDYQDRMSDTYRDDTVGSRDRFIDRRETSRYQDVTYRDRVDNSRTQRDVLEESKRELDEGFAELSQWQRDLARETREIAERRRQLELSQYRAESLTADDVSRVRYETSANQASQYRPYELDRLRDYRSPLVVAERYADSRNTNQSNYASPSLGSYATLASPIGDPNDPRFAQYAKNNLDQVARLNQKFAAMQQANELAALENKVDNEYQKQQLQLAQAKLNNGGRTVKTLIDDGEVISTLGGNLAAGRAGYIGDRYAANFGTSSQNHRGVADMSMRSGRQDFGGGSNQQPVSSGASDKLVRALWFIALLSIGMNMYLALLARSFYSRYNELADELRETFTSSVDYSSPTRSSRSLRSSESASSLAHRAT